MQIEPTARHTAIAVVRKAIEAAYRGDAARLAECYARDAVAVSPAFGEVRGRANIVATWGKLFSTFPDMAVEVSDTLVDGDRVAVLGSVKATDRVGWFGLPATGGPISYRLVLLFTIADGLITHDERIYDSTGVIERLEKAHLDKEMKTAADVQRALLARTAHVGSFFESVGHSVPCRAIGGDFFDFVELPSGDIGIALGDVAGKGPAAALLAAMLQGMLMAEAPAGDGPAAALARMNRRMAARRFESRFATLVYGVLSPNGRLTYSSAGHNPPVLVSGGRLRRLTSGGPLLGAFGHAAFEEETIRLADADTLVMFTDGVTEARNAADDEFGDDRLLSCVTAAADAPPAIVLGRIFEDVQTFCQRTDQTDDITVMVTRFCAAAR